MKKTNKREPTLLDEWLLAGAHDTYGGARSSVPPVSKFLSAHKFVFDKDASAFVGDLLKRAPLEVLQEHEFARFPYDLTWVEIDHPAYYEALGLMLDPAGGYDTKFGILYDHGRVWQIASTGKGHPIMLPLTTWMHIPTTFEHELEQAQMCGMSRLIYRSHLLGSINVTDRDWWLNEKAKEIARSHRTVFEKNMVKPEHDREEVWRTVMVSGAGFLKLIIALGLLLTRPGSRVITLNEVGHERGFWRGRNLVYKAHNKVTIRLAHRDPVARFTAGLATGLHRRRHGVRGHWAQQRGPAYRGCDHQWDIVSINRDKYQCVKCGCKRWWRASHMRGDATRGFVTKEYDVTE